jgi:hypothetical protein
MRRTLVVMTWWVALLVGLGVGVAIADEAVEAPALTRDALVGAWDTAAVDGSQRHDLMADGRFRAVYRQGERVSEFVGAWTLENERLVLRADGESIALTLGVRRVGDHVVDTFLPDDERSAVWRWVRDVPERPADPPLVGTWVAEDAEAEGRLTLEGETYRWVRGGRTTSGTWKRAPGAIHLVESGQDPPLVVTFNLRFLGPDRLELTLGMRSARPATWRREGAASDVPPAPPTAAGLVGEWFVRGDGIAVSLTLNADGTFRHVYEEGDAREVSQGTWTVEGDVLVGRPSDEDTPYRLRWSMPDADTLHLVEDGEVTILTRRGTTRPPGPGAGALSEEARALVGTWLMRAENVELRLELGADGRFVQSYKGPEGEQTTRGTFTLQGGVLTARVDTGEVETLRVRLVDPNTLELLDEAGQGVRMIRQ